MLKHVLSSLAFLLACSEALACNAVVAEIADQVLTLAADLPQIDADPREQGVEDQMWVGHTRPIGGGYRYLLHDVVVQLARAECWQPAEAAIAKIENLGVQDRARAALAKEFARAQRFEDA